MYMNYPLQHFAAQISFPLVSDPTKKNIVRRRPDFSPWSLKYNRFIVTQGPSGQMRNL